MAITVNFIGDEASEITAKVDVPDHMYADDVLMWMCELAVPLYHDAVQEANEAPENSQELWQQTGVLHSWAVQYRRMFALSQEAVRVATELPFKSGNPTDPMYPKYYCRHWGMRAATALAPFTVGYPACGTIKWGDREIAVSYEASDMLLTVDHISIQTLEMDPEPLPVSATGYHSYYFERIDILESGGILPLVRGLLDEAAADPAWKAGAAARAQMELF